MVLTDRELFEHADPFAVAPFRAHDLLDVDVPRLDVVELLDLVLLADDRQLAVPLAVGAGPHNLRYLVTKEERILFGDLEKGGRPASIS